jgi:hypothetical protein
VANGPDLFVSNPIGGNGYGSLIEVNASTGALVRVISGPAYRFDDPDAMVLSGRDLFVANSRSGSVTELPVQSR